MKLKLIVKGAGVYKAHNLWQLIIEVLKHRFWHLLNDGKWID